MKGFRLDASRNNFLIAALLVLFIPLIFYIFIYIPRQESYFSARYFRALKRITDNVTAKIENMNKVYKHTAGKIDITLKQKQQAGADEPLSEKIDAVITQVKNLEYISEPDLRKTKKDSTWLQADGKDFWIYYQPIYDQHRSVFQFRTSIKKLIEPLVKDKVFEDVLIVHKSGNVIYQQSPFFIYERNPKGLKINRLDSISTVDKDESVLQFSTTSSAKHEVKIAGTRYILFMHPFDPGFTSGKNSGKMRTGNWAVCGLIRSSTFMTNSLSINYLYIIIFLFLILIAIISWPFLKAVFIGKNEKLRLTDVLFMSISFLISTGMITFLLLDFYVYLNFKTKLDDQLIRLANNISSNFSNEIDSAYLQLQAYNEIIKKEAATGKHNDRDTRTHILKQAIPYYPKTYPYFEMVYWMNSDGEQEKKWSIKRETTPLINVSSRDYFQKIINDKAWKRKTKSDTTMRFWLESIYSWNTGENLAVLSSPIENHPTLKVSAMIIHLISLMNPVVGKGNGFCIIEGNGTVLFHSDKTKNLQENFLAECDKDRWLLSAIEGKATETGNVKYSGQDYRLYIRPIENMPLYLLVFRNKEIFRTMNLEFLTIAMIIFLAYSVIFMLIIGFVYFLFPGYRAGWVWPLRSRSTQYKALLLSNSILAIIFLVWIFIANTFELVHLAFLFPFFTFILIRYVLRDESEIREKKWFIDAFLLLIVLGISILLGLKIFNDLPTTIIIILLLLITGAATRKLLSVSILQKIKLVSFQRLYVSGLVISLITLSVLPAISFFKFAVEAQTSLYLKHMQKNLVDDTIKRNDRIRYYFKNISIPDSLLIKRLLVTFNDIYADFFFGTEISIDNNIQIDRPDLSSPRQFLKNQFRSIMPLYNKITIETRSLIPDFAADSSWQWLTRTDSTETKKLDYKRFWWDNQNKSGFLISSTLPKLSGDDASLLNILLLIVFILFAFGLYMSILFIARRILIIKLAVTDYQTAAKLLRKKDFEHNILMIGPPRSGKSKAIYDLKNLKIIDIVKHKNAQKWTDIITKEELDHLNSIAIDHFDYNMSDNRLNEIKLHLLEELINNYQKRVIMTSTLDPLLYFGGSKIPSENEEKPEENSLQNQNRWAIVLSAFLKYYVVNEGDPKKFKTDIEKRRRKINRQIAKSSLYSKYKINKVIDLLIEECLPNQFLQKIGREIINDPGFVNLNTEQLIFKIADFAHNFYHATWINLSREEKMTLIHIAQNGFVSSKNSAVLWSLLQRKILTKDPVLQTFNKSFAKYILSAQQPEELAQWEKEETTKSAWKRLRLPFVLILGGIITFLFVTQPEAFESSLGIVTGITAIIPILFRFLDLFQRGKPRNAA